MARTKKPAANGGESIPTEPPVGREDANATPPTLVTPAGEEAVAAQPSAPAAASAEPAETPGEPAVPQSEPEREAGTPYRAVFTSTTHGFELGENRRFKQRVFTFRDRPDDAVLAVLKEHGFTYRPAEKAWTVPITAESRVLTDRLAREFASGGRSAGRG